MIRNQGGLFRLAFARRLRGPLALGFACHFGLGILACLAFARRLVGRERVEPLKLGVIA